MKVDHAISSQNVGQWH